MLQHIGCISPKAEPETKACMRVVSLGVWSQEAEVGSKSKERRRKSQHKDELLSWPLLHETGYWVLWDHVWCPCYPLGKQCSISSYCPLVKSWPIHMHESQAVPKEPCLAAVEKMHSEEHGTILRVAPMKLLEICTELVTTAVSGIRDKAKMLLGYKELSTRDNQKRMKCS